MLTRRAVETIDAREFLNRACTSWSEVIVTVSFYPKRLLLMAVAIIALGSILAVAIDARQGVAVGLLGVSAYVLIELLVTFNPVVWWRQRRHRLP